MADFDIRTTSTATPVGTLSGGNQQKVILAREIGREVRLLVASQPTRGLDVGSIEFVHRRIVEQRDQGLAVLLISSELDEIYALSDRIAVMYEGKITGFRDPNVPAEELGMLMAGATDADAAASGHGGRAWAGGVAAEETGLIGCRAARRRPPGCRRGRPGPGRWRAARRGRPGRRWRRERRRQRQRPSGRQWSGPE